MDLLIFIAVAVLIVGTPLVLFLARSRLRPGATNMVLIGSAAGEAEVHTWAAALRSAGIAAHLKNVGDVAWYGPAAYSYEIWVRARDEARARDVLGL
jgi:hypothetical protein